MKITWLSRSSGLFGAELGMVESIGGLTARGHEVCAVIPRPGPLTPLLEGAGASVAEVPYACWITSATGWGRLDREALRATARRAAMNLTAAPRMREVLRTSRPDVVITNTLAIPLGALVAKALAIPHVWFVRELSGGSGHGIQLDFGERF